jgi:hypothetical protein
VLQRGALHRTLHTQIRTQIHIHTHRYTSSATGTHTHTHTHTQEGRPLRAAAASQSSPEGTWTCGRQHTHTQQHFHAPQHCRAAVPVETCCSRVTSHSLSAPPLHHSTQRDSTASAAPAAVPGSGRTGPAPPAAASASCSTQTLGTAPWGPCHCRGGSGRQADEGANGETGQDQGNRVGRERRLEGSGQLWVN